MNQPAASASASASAPVLVGVDGSSAGLDAVRWAGIEARRRRAPMHLVAAFGWPAGDDTRHRLRGAAYRSTMREQCDRELAEAVAVVAEEFPDLTVTHGVELGYPVATLAKAAAQAQLLVLGDRGRGGVAGLLLGSVAVSMAAHAACPVVVVRGRGSGAQDGPVVVGVDGSPASESAIAFAFAAADARDVELVAVHTWNNLMADPGFPTVHANDELEAPERELLAERLAGWSQRYPGVRVTQVVRRARTAPLLVDHSTRAQLVVVGSHAHDALVGLVLGSVSHAVLHHADCPVAVVRPAIAV
ncbi:MAG: universal stress protein [Mycobacteriaceae bacterium]